MSVKAKWLNKVRWDENGLVPVIAQEVSTNDVLMFEVDDDAHRDRGQAGLWTKADSVMLFDDLVIKPSAKR